MIQATIRELEPHQPERFGQGDAIERLGLYLVDSVTARILSGPSSFHGNTAIL